MRTYRPSVDVLEDRTVPALFRPLTPLPPPPATHFQIIAPEHVETGKPFNVVISALDKSNHLVPTFRGTVQISLATADTGAAFPASFAFSAADKGRHTFQVTLAATGGQTIKAASGAIAGNDALTVDPAATHFGVSVYGKALAGTPTIISVIALDTNNNVVPGYTGTVHFTSTDFYANIPANYTFNAADGGSHLFQVTFGTLGMQSVAVKSTTGGSIVGAVQVKVLSPWYYPSFNYYPVYGGYGYGYGWGSPWF